MTDISTVGGSWDKEMGKLEGQQYCGEHQGNSSYYAKHNCVVCKLQVEVAKLKASAEKVLEPEVTASRKLNILDHIGDRVSDFLYSDRQEDEELPVGSIEEAIEEGEITIDEMVEKFKTELTNGIKGQT